MSDRAFFVALLCILAGLAVASDSPFLAFFIVLIAVEVFNG
jgi:hypothetical protein